jgi:hypothetical protein
LYAAADDDDDELNGKVHEDAFFCQPSPTRITGEAIFKVIDDSVKDSHLNWGRCVGMSRDGARAKTGVKKGVLARDQAVALEAKSTHCCVHREALTTQDTSVVLQKVLEEAVK